MIPPFPVERAIEREGWHTGPLLSHLDRPRTVAVLLLRLGGFAVGIFEGQRLTVSKVGSPFVKGRHKKGGSSSGRFARRREGQARMLYDKACETLREKIEPALSSIEHFAVGGDRLTLTDFEKRCPFVQRPEEPPPAHGAERARSAAPRARRRGARALLVPGRGIHAAARLAEHCLKEVLQRDHPHDVLSVDDGDVANALAGHTLRDPPDRRVFVGRGHVGCHHFRDRMVGELRQRRFHVLRRKQPPHHRIGARSRVGCPRAACSRCG